MKKLLWIGYFVCFCIHLNAQQFLLSPKEAFSLKTDDFGVIGKFNKQTAVYQRHEGQSQIILYNAAFMKEQAISLPFMDENLVQVHFSTTGKRVSVFYQVRKQKLLQLFVCQLKEDQTLSEPKLLFSIPMVQFRQRDGFRIADSENKTKFFISADLRTEAGNYARTMLLDESLTELFSTDQLIERNDVYLSDISLVSNKGDVCIILSEKMTPKRVMDNIQLLVCGANQHAFVKNSLDLNGKFISDAQLLIDNSTQNLYFFGYFSDNKYSPPRGFFMSTFAENQTTPLHSHFVPIALQVSSGKADLRDMKIRNYCLKKNGGLEIATENFYQQVRSVSSYSPSMSASFINMPENARTVNEFNYEEITIFNFKTEGGLAWNQPILKEQQTTDDNGIFSSFGLMEHPKGKVYIFNDLNLGNTRLMAAYVTTKGIITVKELPLSQELNDWDIMPRSAIQISATEIVMPCVTKNYLCFLKIAF